MPAIKDYWPLVLDALKSKISTSTYKAWFSNVHFIATSNHGRKIVLSVPSTFNKNYLQTKFKSQLQEAISKYYPQVIHIDFEVAKTQLPQPQQDQEGFFGQSVPEIGERVKNEDPVLISTTLPKKNLNNLNPKYTFENFVVTSSNELAVSIAKSVIKEPGTLYNPVFIYSGVGLGKTHLLQAVGHKFLEEYPGYNIKYITSETFVNQYVEAIQKRKGNEFKEFYRSVDLLLIDDIQFIAGKEATQEAFFHTFNELHQNNKQIIITSDKHPKSIDGIESRLISRFEWGVVIDIYKPDLEDRLAVIKDKVERLNLTINKDHMLKIAEKVGTNFRDIEGVLNRIQARLRLLPDREFRDFELDKILSGYEYSSPIRIEITYSPVSAEKIINCTAQYFSLTKEDILSKSREKNLAMARQIAMYLCKADLDLSLPVIGKSFQRDHTTVLHACKKVESLLKLENGKIHEQLRTIRGSLQTLG